MAIRLEHSPQETLGFLEASEDHHLLMWMRSEHLVQCVQQLEGLALMELA